jgi:hypothetical protein
VKDGSGFSHDTDGCCWQVRGLPAASLVPVTHLGDHDFWPEEYVLERLEDRSATPRVGIVRSRCQPLTPLHCISRPHPSASSLCAPVQAPSSSKRGRQGRTGGVASGAVLSCAWKRGMSRAV